MAGRDCWLRSGRSFYVGACNLRCGRCTQAMNLSSRINLRAFTLKKGLRFAKRKADTAFYVVFKPLSEASRRARRKRFYAADRNREIVLFLNAEAGITSFYSAHAILARTL